MQVLDPLICQDILRYCFASLPVKLTIIVFLSVIWCFFFSFIVFVQISEWC